MGIDFWGYYVASTGSKHTLGCPLSPLKITTMVLHKIPGETKKHPKGPVLALNP